jgi:hypothetical protein
VITEFEGKGHYPWWLGHCFACPNCHSEFTMDKWDDAEGTKNSQRDGKSAYIPSCPVCQGYFALYEWQMDQCPNKAKNSTQNVVAEYQQFEQQWEK